MPQLKCQIPFPMVIDIDLDENHEINGWRVEENSVEMVSFFLRKIADQLNEKIKEGIASNAEGRQLFEIDITDLEGISMDDDEENFYVQGTDTQQ